MKIRAFITHKLSEEFVDCQDRFCVSKDTKSIAVSDGMGESFFQDVWADLLCKYFVQNHGWLPTKDSIRPLQDEWLNLAKKHLENQELLKSPYSYLIRNAINNRASAGATFLGVRIEDNFLKYAVIGDSCLIKLTDGIKIERIEDIITSQQGSFGSYPDYIDSSPIQNGKGMIKEDKIILNAGNVFLMVSDPFSDYFYDRVITGDNCHELISQILALKNHQDYEKLVDEWRLQGMHNDDSTLVILEFDGNDDFNLEIIDDIDELIKHEGKDSAKSEQVNKESEMKTSVTNSIITENDTVSKEKNQHDNKEISSVASENGVEFNGKDIIPMPPNRKGEKYNKENFRKISNDYYTNGFPYYKQLISILLNSFKK